MSFDPISMYRVTAEIDANRETVKITRELMSTREFREIVGMAQEMDIDPGISDFNELVCMVQDYKKGKVQKRARAAKPAKPTDPVPE